VPQPSTGHRIFVVDDDPVISSTLATILSLHGYHATPYTSPLEALQAARTEAPDLLISDVVMPRLSGVDLAIQMQEHHPACKVLLFSGQAATTDLLQDTHSGGHDFELLQKPAHPAEILKKIRSMIQRTLVPPMDDCVAEPSVGPQSAFQP
jgi:DNA-binding response OmpR family regulator